MRPEPPTYTDLTPYADLTDQAVAHQLGCTTKTDARWLASYVADERSGVHDRREGQARCEAGVKAWFLLRCHRSAVPGELWCRQHHPESVSREPAPEEFFSYSLSMNIRGLRRLAAKIALCAGTREWGDEYLLSPLGEWMRVVLDVWSDWPVDARTAPLEMEHAGGDWPMTADELEGLTSQAQRLFSPILAAATKKELPSADLGLRTPIALFMPVGGGQQAVFSAVVLGLTLPVLAAPHALPAVARDGVTVLMDL